MHLNGASNLCSKNLPTPKVNKLQSPKLRLEVENLMRFRCTVMEKRYQNFPPHSKLLYTSLTHTNTEHCKPPIHIGAKAGTTAPQLQSSCAASAYRALLGADSDSKPGPDSLALLCLPQEEQHVALGDASPALRGEEGAGGRGEGEVEREASLSLGEGHMTL